MNKLEILKHPNPILKKKSEEISQIDNKIKDLALNMVDLVKNDPETAGLAAPQVGFSIRLIAVKIEDKVVALVNPKITRKSFKKVLDYESCLSLPGQSAPVKRHAWVKVEAQTIDNKPFKIKVKDFSARLLQHEIDHLDGMLYIDRVESIE